MPDVQVDHLVIGGGVIGLAVARELTRLYPDKSTFLVERHKRPGEETSSRNSEVIHAGLYYPATSLKTNLCLRGRELLYQFCEDHGVPHKQTGKLVVGTRDSKSYLEGIIQHVAALAEADGNIGATISGERCAPPLRLITGDEARELEPDLGSDVGWTLESPRTGIVSSHDLMAALERQILDCDQAEIVYDTDVVSLRPCKSLSCASTSATSSKRGAGSLQGWMVETQTEGGEVDALLARHVINASGLNGPAALNSLVRGGHFGSGAEQIPAWYSKGNYASYSRSKGGIDNVRRLIYPLPDMGSAKDKHGHQGLGTHLTLDLDGNVRFGPDTDWLKPPPNAAHEKEDQLAHADWWSKNLVALRPTAATLNQSEEEDRLKAMHESVTAFLPGIRLEGLAPDYAGIRPKLRGLGAGFADFAVLYHSAANLEAQSVWQNAFATSNNAARNSNRKNAREALFRGDVEAHSPQPSLITLCGIESPGLTSSLALGELAAELVARRGWGEQGDAFRRRAKTPPGAYNEDAGSLDAWA